MQTYKLIKFESGTCAFCKSMDKQKTLEKFAAKHPEVTVLKCMIADDKGVPYKDGERWANLYGINALPTLIFETGDGRELVRIEGAAPPSALEKLFKAAQERAGAGAIGAPAGGPSSAADRKPDQA
jgi:thioredoxin-related protein